MTWPWESVITRVEPSTGASGPALVIDAAPVAASCAQTAAPAPDAGLGEETRCVADLGGTAGSGGPLSPVVPGGSPALGARAGTSERNAVATVNTTATRPTIVGGQRRRRRSTPCARVRAFWPGETMLLPFVSPYVAIHLGIGPGAWVPRFVSKRLLGCIRAGWGAAVRGPYGSLARVLVCVRVSGLGVRSAGLWPA
jgi:hypothetical protein